MRYLLAIAIALSASSVAANPPKPVQVKGHWKADGTYVQPHTRTSPNNTTSDNWSTAPNVNPYTGKQGKKEPQPDKPKKQDHYSGL